MPAVYLVNDVVDVERDRRHPVKRNRPIASGALPGRHAIVLAALATALAVGAGVAIREPLLVVAMLRVGQLLVGLGMLATYLTWAGNETTAGRPWHLLSAVPLAAALIRFSALINEYSERTRASVSRPIARRHQ
jgi:4-hydroxybenzoate polyprenyltransferase